MTDRARWAIVTSVLFVLLTAVVWVVVADAPFVRWLIRLYQDKHFLKETVRSWGWMAPLVFIAIHAFPAIISPLPCEVTAPAAPPPSGTFLPVTPSTIRLPS